MPSPEQDAALRAAAFAWVRRMQGRHGLLTSAHISQGFRFKGARIPIWHPQQGIFKPKEMSYLLSIKTVYPSSGSKVWYVDQKNIHEKIYAGDLTVEYAFMGRNPNAAQNQWLRGAYELDIPVIYFLGVAPKKYQAIVPAFIADWNPATLTSSIVFGMPYEPDGPRQAPPLDTSGPSFQFPRDAMERRYGLRTMQRRLRQASFRAAVMDMYGRRCAVTREATLPALDAAHIKPYSEGGPHDLQNGLLLRKDIHSLFDSGYVTVTRDLRFKVSPRIKEEFENGRDYYGLDGKEIWVPSNAELKPDPRALSWHNENCFR